MAVVPQDAHLCLHPNNPAQTLRQPLVAGLPSPGLLQNLGPGQGRRWPLSGQGLDSTLALGLLPTPIRPSSL